MQSTLKKPWSPGKSQGSGNIGSKLLEFVVGSNFIVTLTHSLAHSEGQRSSLRLRGSKLQKQTTATITAKALFGRSSNFRNQSASILPI